MSEFDIIRKTKKPNTLETIKRDLRNLGLKEGDTVIVHSSMSRIGWISGDELTVVQALLQVVGEEGTIVMPAQTGSNTNPDEWAHPPVPDSWKEEIRNTMPAFNINNSPTRGMGKISECFRKYEGTVRSNHPQVSFCANGKYKNEIVGKHDLSYAFGMNSPLGKLYELDAKILLLGVGYSNCTSMHLAETLVAKPNIKKNGSAVEIDGKREWIWYDDIDYNSDCFEEIGELFEKERHEVNINMIGGAYSRVLKVKDIVNFTKDVLDQYNNLNVMYTNCIKEDIDNIYKEFETEFNLFEDKEKISSEEILASNRERIENNLDKYTKFICDEKTIGYCSFIEEDRKIEIDDFFIKEEYQNRGFGKKILNHCYNIAKEKNNNVLYTIVFSDNKRAIELFAKNGFSVREIVGTNKCVMSKKIDNCY